MVGGERIERPTVGLLPTSCDPLFADKIFANRFGPLLYQLGYPPTLLEAKGLPFTNYYILLHLTIKNLVPSSGFEPLVFSV